MKLIDNAGKSWRMVSMQAMVAAGAVQLAWESLPPSLLASVPPEIVRYVTLGLLALGIVGRLVKQEGVSGGASSEDKNEVHP